MQKHKCGCRRSNCSTCSPKKNKCPPACPTGPEGPEGPEGPDAIILGGRAAVDAECNLIVFAGRGIASMNAFPVTATARGWQIFSDPLPQAIAQNLLITTAHTYLGTIPQINVPAEPPPIIPTILPQGIVPAGGGLFQARFTIYLEDANTGLPVDPCCPRFTVVPFAAVPGGTQFLFDDSIPPPDPACQPPTPPPGLAAASGPQSSDEERIAAHIRLLNGES